MKFELSTKVTDVSAKGKTVTVKAENKKGEAVEYRRLLLGSSGSGEKTLYPEGLGERKCRLKNR
ncbi:MAG: hypothetical protein R2836_05995 [Chitinophagales bacterium]